MARRGRGSRQKGNGFELIVARQLTSWWFPKKYPTTNGVHAENLPFRRTPNSGGWSKKRKSTLGDQMCPRSFPFVIECKNREEWTWDQAFKTGTKWAVDGYWQEVVRLVPVAKRFPLLIFSKNYMDVFARLNVDTWTRFVRPRLEHAGAQLKPIMIFQGFVYLYFEQLLSVPSEPLNLKKNPLADGVNWSKYAV